MTLAYKMILSGLAGLLIGAGAVSYVYEEYGGFKNISLLGLAERSDTETGTSSANGKKASPTDSVLTPTGNLATLPAVSLTNQSAGLGVLLQSVELTSPGWVVIHEDRTGVPGNALGAARFEAGVHTAASVTLLRGTEKGATYYAVIYGDNGDRIFNLKDDFPVRDESGNPILARFVAE